VKFHRNIGMLFVRQAKSLPGNLCKTCLSKHYWSFMGKNLLLGPWGTISLFVTPIYMVTNTVSYVKALRNLRGAPE
jgi:hypothetical protein